MASALNVTKLRVVSHRSNRLPSSGWVTFSDDKSYHWSRDPESNIFFSSYRTRQGTDEHFIFNSVKRAKIMEEYFDTHAVETSVFKVTLGG